MAAVELQQCKSDHFTCAEESISINAYTKILLLY